MSCCARVVRQVPWVEESLIGEHSINNALDAEGREVAIGRDIHMWRGISGETTADPYRDYLEAFPKGMFADFARQRITRLSYVSSQTGAVANQQFAALDITKDTVKIADALNILGFTGASRSTIDLDDLEAAAAAIPRLAWRSSGADIGQSVCRCFAPVALSWGIGWPPNSGGYCGSVQHRPNIGCGP